MILLVSGEGPSDIGSCIGGTGICDGVDFEPGPMSLLIDQLIAPIWGYSPLEITSFIYVSKHDVADASRKLEAIALPGLKKAQETIYFFKNARALARMALQQTTPQCPVGAVLFRDSDGTCSMGDSLWQDKWNSIAKGFEAEAFPLGVPMVPKPKSESWLLCAIQQFPYNNCARFENISGNDASPNSAKRYFGKALQARSKTYNDVCDLIREGIIDAVRLVMPSYDCFRNRLEEVAQIMLRHRPV